jgi:tRNA pseudouridine38-40 synthase
VAVIRLDLAYDGSGFRGFARQPRTRTVEGVLGDALERILRRRPRLSVAGRTDAGVHAEGQVVSFEADEDPERIQRALNGILAPEVVIGRARVVPDGFDARRSATAREYRYRIRTAGLSNPFTARYEWFRPGEYRLSTMRRAASLLEGEHDFRSFCRAPKDDPPTVRRLERLTVRREGDLVFVRARANGFLHQMVRSLVGTLVAVGEGKMDPEVMPEVLRARDRAAAGPIAPPDGLVLVRVVYPRTATPRSI